MYRLLVAPIARGVFSHLSAGDYPRVLRWTAPDVRHVFAGEHALGGERRSREALERWFERVYRLFPRLEFEVHEVVAGGWPWRLVMAVRWTARVTPCTGEPYTNQGVHLVTIRWGRVTEIRAYEDSQAVVEACARLVAAGVEEAGAAPITG